ncbi:MAG TPA: zf-HC2 domain-containing protein [Ktedonosporobacter sp.]|nr:zf-HC2 domain-containing protein [Ktedonosporobacter sp.]
MNCEQVKDSLSAYLDKKLALEERQEVATHVQTCAACSAILMDFHRFDTLITSLPRVHPDETLRHRIFTSLEYLELTGTADVFAYPQATYQHPGLDTSRHPRLIALPGGRSSSSDSPETRKRRSTAGQRVMQLMIVASILLTLGIASFIGWNVFKSQERTTTQTLGGITPPTGPQQGPIPAGLRFVFQRDGALWSAPTDGGTGTVRLTPSNTTVAANWEVRPAQPGHPAGNMLAYIDLQQGFVHTIRSDAQNDTQIRQPLLKAGVPASSLWDTEAGTDILNSLTWSKDGTMLAFVANPTGTPGLYIYSTSTGEVQQVPLSLSGAVAHPVWSPDGIRIAFELTHNSKGAILDYNTQNHGILTIASIANAQSNAADTVLTLDWASSIDTPTITWSVGAAGHIHTIWSQRVGTENTLQPRLLLQGDYQQATYSRTGQRGIGSWLVVKSFGGQTADLISVDLNSSMIRLTSGKQVSFAQWSPDGTQVYYFDAFSSGLGALHVIHLQSGNDALVAMGVTNDPAPTWSPDSQRLVYSTGSHTLIAPVQNIRTSQPLKIQGPASAFSWSATSPSQLVLAMSDGEQGIYLVDTQHDTALQLDKAAFHGPIWWTQIP